MPELELGSVPLPVVRARIDRFIAEDGKGPYRIWSEQVSASADPMSALTYSLFANSEYS